MKVAEDFGGVCCIKGCDDKVLALGLCNKHWRRNKKYGSPVALKMPIQANRGRPLVERFMERIHVDENGCWIWTAGKDQDGYGLFRGLVGDALYHRAHRFSVAYHRGEHPAPEQNVCHSCDVPACVNPAHLFIGSVAGNQQDKWRKGRGNVKKGTGHWSTSLTEDDVRAIRASNDKQSEIAERHGITQTTVSDIRRRKSWAHVE